MHSVVTECFQLWKEVFHTVQKFSSFDRPGRVTIVDEETNIDMDYK